MPPPNVSIAVLGIGLRLENDELCRLTESWVGAPSRATIRFVDTVPPRQPPLETAIYRQVAIDFPEATRLGVSIWECERPADRVLIARRLGHEVVQSVLNYMRDNPYLDCRMVALSHRERLRDDLDDILRLGFLHLPHYNIENARAMAARCLVNMTNKRAFRQLPPLRAGRSAAMIVPTFQDQNISPMPGAPLPILGMRSRPLVFDAPLSSYGFITNPQIAMSLQEGIEVSDKQGLAMHGPHIGVPPGRYSAALTLRLKQFEDRRGGAGEVPEGYMSFDAYTLPDSQPLAEDILSAVDMVRATMEVEIEFVIPQRDEPSLLELRVHQHSNIPFLIASIELSRLE